MHIWSTNHAVARNLYHSLADYDARNGEWWTKPTNNKIGQKNERMSTMWAGKVFELCFIFKGNGTNDSTPSKTKCHKWKEINGREKKKPLKSHIYLYAYIYMISNETLGGRITRSIGKQTKPTKKNWFY